MDYLKEKLGARQVSGDRTKGKVRIKLFFPNVTDPSIESIRVAGSFQTELGHTSNWDFENGLLLKPSPHAEGTIWSVTSDTEINEGFYEYKYLVTFKGAPNDRRIVTDPFTRYGGREFENAAFVIGGSHTRPRPGRLMWHRPHRTHRRP